MKIRHHYFQGKTINQDKAHIQVNRKTFQTIAAEKQIEYQLGQLNLNRMYKKAFNILF